MHVLPLGAVAAVFAASMATGCRGGINTPVPTNPVLEGVRVVGSRVCGSVTIHDIYTFDCPPLPITEASGWLMTPGLTPSVSDPQRLHPNRIAVLTVSTPSLTSIDVEFAPPGSASNIPLTQVDPNRPGSPQEVGTGRQVGVTSTDDGTRKTWHIEVNVSTCTDVRKLQIFNRSARFAGRMGPLSVYFLREPGEQICIGSGGGGGPGPYAGYSPGTPVAPPPSSGGSCPGGGSGTLFQVCENCANLHPPELNFYSAGTYCSWSDVLAVYGYSGAAVVKPQICRLWQVASQEACEGPP